MSKQTAVEWLVDELLNGKILMPSLIEEVKAMEKKQILEAFEEGFLEGCCYKSDGTRHFRPFEKYYNEKFGGEQ